MGDCYSDQTLPIRIIISLRKDYYSDLIEFEQVLPHLHIFMNHYRPDTMTPQEVKEAIIQPLRELKSAVTYDSALLDTLVDELSCNETELPLLQLICTRLYETLGKNKKRITLKMYEALGKTEGVLKNYLNEVLSGLPEKEKVLAKDILKAFVRSDLTKQALSENRLIAQVKSTRNELDCILAQLINARLIRRDDLEGETRYELVHEYLMTEIVKWIDTADREFKRAEDLLRSELANWYSYGHLISPERLELLHPYRERFTVLNAKDWECLLRSAIKAEEHVGDEYLGADVTDWAKVAFNIDYTLLFKAIVESLIIDLQDYEHEWTRANAAECLAKIGKYGGVHALEALLTALQDEVSNVRAKAAEALGELGDVRAIEPLLFALQDEVSSVRVDAARALGKLGDMRTVEPLLSALQDGNLGAAEALGKLGDTRAFEPLIMALKSKNSALRRWAAWGLGELGDVRAVEPLIVALQNESDLTRPGPVRALGELGDVRAVEPLIAVLEIKNGSFVMREDAVRALGKIGNIRAVERLKIALQDEDYNIQEMARKILGSIKENK